MEGNQDLRSSLVIAMTDMSRYLGSLEKMYLVVLRLSERYWSSFERRRDRGNSVNTEMSISSSSTKEIVNCKEVTRFGN